MPSACNDWMPQCILRVQGDGGYYDSEFVLLKSFHPANQPKQVGVYP